MRKTPLVQPSCAAEHIILPKRLGTFAAIGQADPNPSERRCPEDEKDPLEEDYSLLGDDTLSPGR